MQTLYFSINPDSATLISGHLVYFCLFTTLALFVAGAIACLVRRGQQREAALLGREPGRRWPGLLFGALVAGPLLIYIYVDSWGSFFQVRLEPDQLSLDYFLPRRTTEFRPDTVVRLTEESVVRKGGNLYRLIITTSDGRSYSSQLCSRETLRANRRLLDGYLSRTP